MLDKRTPLRQSQFTNQGFVVVHHRLEDFNLTILAPIEALRAVKRPAKK